jgi:hypothetical protein
MFIWNILRPFGIFYGHFGNVVIIWYIFHRFGVLCQEKSGNPAQQQQQQRFFVVGVLLPETRVTARRQFTANIFSSQLFKWMKSTKRLFVTKQA